MLGLIVIGMHISMAAIHVLVIVGLFPKEMIWGGVLGPESTFGELLFLEILAIGVLAIFTIPVAIKSGMLFQRAWKAYPRAINFSLWVIFIYYLLNAAGNLLSPVSRETEVFLPFTIVLAVLILIIALAQRSSDSPL